MSNFRPEYRRSGSESIAAGADDSDSAAFGRQRYLANLNPAQREAVETLDGPVLVLAGAGVGKTRVLTSRIAHLMATGRARGYDILAVTFTNKAAREMQSRLESLTGLRESAPWMGTFHSIGAKLLRRHAELAGLKPNFTILDTDDQLRLLKQVMKDADVDDKRWPARGLASEIDSWKNRALGPSEVPRGEAAGFRQRQGRRALWRISDAAEAAQRRRFRRSPARDAEAAARPMPTSPSNISAGSATFWLTNIRTPTRSSICCCGCWPPAIATSAASATTIRRSTAGAAPTSTTSCASSTISRARRSSVSNATIARPATFSAPPRASSRKIAPGSARRSTRKPRSARSPWSSASGTARRRRAT